MIMSTLDPKRVAAAAASRVARPSIMDAWIQAKMELKNNLPKATYDSLIAQITAVATGNTLTLQFPTSRSMEWTEARLSDQVAATVNYLAGQEVEIVYVALNGQQSDVITPEHTAANGRVFAPVTDFLPAAEIRPGFPGFEPLGSNYTQTPDLFFTYVIPHAHGTTIKLVGTVIRQTLGVFEDKRHNRRREEWAVNHRVLETAAGINSRTSLLTALWDARCDGYLILRPLTAAEEIAALKERYGYRPDYTLRLRYPEDPADTPAEARPAYGSRRKAVDND
jgi:hypothetical protein